MLAGEPYHLSIEEIGKLTPYQVQEVYFHERDQAGLLRLPQQGGESYKSRFFAKFRRFGLPAYRIREKWQEYERSISSSRRKRH